MKSRTQRQWQKIHLQPRSLESSASGLALESHPPGGRRRNARTRECFCRALDFYERSTNRSVRMLLHKTRTERIGVRTCAEVFGGNGKHSSGSVWAHQKHSGQCFNFIVLG